MKVIMQWFRHSLARGLVLGALVTAASASAAVVNVSVVNNSFQPASVTVQVNDQVTWNWAAGDGAVPHSTTSETGGLWDSGVHTQPFDFTMTFPTAGTFQYICTIHAAVGMRGTVTVQGSSTVPPAITTQPASQTVTAGDTVAFTVVASGTAPLSYQWKKGGTDIPGANSSSLTLTGVTSADAGSYTVVVNNSAGSTTSSAAVLTVNSLGTAPVITTQPASQTVAAGDTVTFTIVATGTAPLSYQWKKGGNNIPGANSSSLTLTGVTSADAGSYTVVVSNSAGSTTSSAAVLTVNSVVVAPVITTQPSSKTVSAGANVTFTVVATGSSPLSYQWSKDGTAISGAMSSSLSLSNVQTNDAGSYLVMVSNAGGSVTSAEAVLTVQPVTTVTFAAGSFNGLFSDPNGVSPLSSGSFTLKLTATGKFTGKLLRGGVGSSLSGQFDPAGHVQKTIPSASQGSVTVDLQISMDDPDRINGTVSDGAFTANLLADRAGFDGRQKLAPQAGRYTLAIDGNKENSTTTPGGYSFGTITVNAAGGIKLAASLADASKITQSVQLSKNGDWPLFVSLYGGKGSVMSWSKFDEATSDDVGGQVVWIKPNVPLSKLYPAGFNFSTTAHGSRYQAAAKVLTFTNGQLSLSSGGLAGPILNQIALGAGNRVTNLSSNKLTLTFSPSTGLFKGKVMDPGSSKVVLFNGAVLQKENTALGWFSAGNSQSGELTLSSQ